MMALIRVFIDMNSGASVIFVTIGLLRGIQGFAIGIMHVFVQVRNYYTMHLQSFVFLPFILNYAKGIAYGSQLPKIKICLFLYRRSSNQ